MTKLLKMLNVNREGNRKLRNTDKVRFLIWNLPAIKTCPFATDHCKKSCYARKAERVYSQVLPSREANYIDSLSDDFTANMIYTIEKIISGRAYQGKKVIFRIHESGDFYSQAYADKWIEIIKHFENVDNLVFHAYTKSLPYFEKHDIKSSKNLAFIASVWDDTSRENLDLIVKNGYRIYTAVESFDNWYGNKCRCADCAHCQQCMRNNVQAIACEIH